MNCFSFCSSLRMVELPFSMSGLESYAFSECTGLQRVVLPGNCREIGELIFSGCRNLEEIHIPRHLPPTFECNSFSFEPDEEQMYSSVSLVVPTGALENYRNARAWNLFRTIKEEPHVLVNDDFTSLKAYTLSRPPLSFR